MADSAFWRDLAKEFLALQDRLRADSKPTDLTNRSFDVLATRGASAIAGAPDVWVWLGVVMKEDPEFCSSYLDKEVSDKAEFEHSLVMGQIDRLCQLSATFCKKLEDHAVQAEFEEKQRNDPRNWSQFRQQYEAVKSVRELRSEPPEQIFEEFVRQAIARIRGIKPEDVTREQIAFEVAGLFSSPRRHIELIPSDSTKEAATDLPDLLNEPPGMEFLGDRPDRMVKTEKIPTTAEAVSKQLLTEVNSLFKKFRIETFENVEDLAEADEWQRLNHLFRGAGERYAKSSFREERGRLKWSRKNIESDWQAIYQRHAQHFCLLQSRRSDLRVDNVLRVFETKLDFAMSEAMCAAAVCIDGSELPSPRLKTQRSKSDRLLSSYRSELKRAILTQLALHPKATDGEICRGLDADGSVELPSSWKSKVSDRGFFDAYSDAVRRHRVEVTISKVRKDLRKRGLLE
jgi:hypothetical protein